ncbi:UPF0489 family protein [Cohnella sp.]|uniref:UPF0489 family protein n=1 Tax=Cohnella sp. TaxID=1883426 RepID=UPI003566DA23
MSIFEDNYRICFPKKRVFISRNHQWAFAAWTIGKGSGIIGDKTILLHVDAHLDDTWDGVIVEGLHEMGNTEEILEVAGKLEIDNFIWAGFAAKIIDRIIYVCPKDIDSSEPFDLSSWNLEGEQLKPIKQLLREREYNGLRFESIEQFKQHLLKAENLEQVFNTPNSVILDLDLDVFKLKLSDLADRELYPEKQIREQLQFLKNLYSYDMVTIALSPSFCGSDENCEFIFRLFLEEFELNLDEAQPW